MARDRTWKILDWPSQQRPPVLEMEMSCPSCGEAASLPYTDPGCKIIGAIGLSVVFDNPDFKPAQKFMPDEIQCRSCRKIFSVEG